MADNGSSFQLIETILWEENRYFLLGLHMDRLRSSARTLSLSLDEAQVRNELDKIAASFAPDKEYRVRLLLAPNGGLKISHSPLPPPPTYPVKAVLATKNTEKDDPLLRHKTTNRSLYDTELGKARTLGFFDVIFTNTDGEVTEGAITNIIVNKNGLFLTPPISSGVLPGVYRKYLMDSGKIPLKTAILYKEDILGADHVFLINSVRRMMPAEITP
ncbi:MAG: aminotransferase class IV [Candidatus Omnitrophica bacterium]|nr:aminotransferase class IV [Candidatus Omnitrophota bacterium]